MNRVGVRVGVSPAARTSTNEGEEGLRLQV